jgi:tetratricopeptide (TPR) repeat protein
VADAGVELLRSDRTVRFGLSVLMLVAILALAWWLMPAREGDGGTAERPDEIAWAVAREFDRRERGDTARQRPAERTSSIPAYELYLRGNDPALLRSDSAARRGLGYFERAVALDSNYAAAWAGLARLGYRTSQSAPIAERPRLRAAAETAAWRAVTLDPTLADGHGMLGLFRTMARDFSAAEAHLRRAVALDPARAGFREWLSNFLLTTGRMQEALAEAERAVALEPLSPSARAELGRALIASGRCDEAMPHLSRVMAVDPPLLRAAPLIAQCHGRRGRWAEAIATLRGQADRGDALATAFLGYMYARAGQREEAAAIQARLEQRAGRGAEGAYYLAFVPAALGDRDEAFKWLDLGLKDGSFGFPSGRSVPFTDPPFDDLRADPRYERLRVRFLTPP